MESNVGGVADLPPLWELSYVESDEDEESANSLDFSTAKGKACISCWQTEFSLKQYLITIWQPKYGAFNQWKIVCLAGSYENQEY